MVVQNQLKKLNAYSNKKGFFYNFMTIFLYFLTVITDSHTKLEI